MVVGVEICNRGRVALHSGRIAVCGWVADCGVDDGAVPSHRKRDAGTVGSAAKTCRGGAVPLYEKPDADQRFHHVGGGGVADLVVGVACIVLDFPVR